MYCEDPRDLSRAPTLEAFLERHRLLIANCAGALEPGGKLAILMGDYNDSKAGFVPLVFWTLCGPPHNVQSRTNAVGAKAGRDDSLSHFAAAWTNIAGQCVLILPDGASGYGIEREYAIVLAGGVENAVDDQGRGFKLAGCAGLVNPFRGQ